MDLKPKFKKLMRLIKFSQINKNERNMILGNSKIPNNSNNNRINRVLNNTINNHGIIFKRIFLKEQYSRNLSNNKDSNNKSIKIIIKEIMGLKPLLRNLIECTKINMEILIMKKYIKIIILDKMDFIKKIIEIFLMIFWMELRKCKGKLKRR